jgi:hypothetical protein
MVEEFWTVVEAAVFLSSQGIDLLSAVALTCHGLWIIVSHQVMNNYFTLINFQGALKLLGYLMKYQKKTLNGIVINHKFVSRKHLSLSLHALIFC